MNFENDYIPVIACIGVVLGILFWRGKLRMPRTMPSIVPKFASTPTASAEDQFRLAYLRLREEISAREARKAADAACEKAVAELMPEGPPPGEA